MSGAMSERYPLELRERAVRMVAEVPGEQWSARRACARPGRVQGGQRAGLGGLQQQRSGVLGPPAVGVLQHDR